MKLGAKQRLFMRLFPRLMDFLHGHDGWECTQGDGYRDPRVFGDSGESKGYGKAWSLHKLRLAKDINLFIDGEWITDSQHPAWTELGEYWESLHPLCVNGRHFDDANHFSI